MAPRRWAGTAFLPTNRKPKGGSMKSKKWTSVVVMTLVATLAMAVSLGMTAVPVNAQQRSIHRTGSPTQTGAERMSNQTMPQTANGTIETRGRDVRYRVVPIPILPGKTNTIVTDVKSVNNFGHVTGYSFVHTSNFNIVFMTVLGFIWRHGNLAAMAVLFRRS